MWARLHPIARDALGLAVAACAGCLLGLIEQVTR
jgi:hypothetical protein